MKQKISILTILSSIISYASSPTDSINITNYHFKNKLQICYNSTSLSYLRYLNNKSNIKIELALRGNISNNKSEYNSSDQSRTDYRLSTSNSNNKGNGQSGTLTIQYLRYLSKHDNINLFFALGPSVSISRSDSDNEDSGIDERFFSNYDYFYDYHKSNQNSLNKSIGANFTIGAEFNLTKRVGVFTLYDIKYQYRWLNQKSYQESVNNSTRGYSVSNESYHRWLIDFVGFQFGIYILF